MALFRLNIDGKEEGGNVVAHVGGVKESLSGEKDEILFTMVEEELRKATGTGLVTKTELSYFPGSIKATIASPKVLEEIVGKAAEQGHKMEHYGSGPGAVLRMLENINAAFTTSHEVGK